jgi:predicted DNA helicase
MTPPILLKGIVKDRELTLALRRLKLKQSDIKSIHYANNMTLIHLKKRVKNKPKKEWIPSRKVEEEIIKANDFVEEYRYLIERERIAEIEAQIREIKTLSAHERELFGRAILGLKGKYLGEEFYFHLVRFGRDKRIDTEISNGDIVLVSYGDPLSSDLTGTVYEIKPHYITVAFENAPPKWALKDRIRIDLYINDITFKRMEENLLELLHATGRKRHLRNIILGLEQPKAAKSVSFNPKNEELNPSQQDAVSLALGSEDLFLIHGPPGTGKTSTLIELIFQESKQKNRVLATADSNTAVDNMLMRLAKHDLNIVRIGHPVRIAESLHKYSIHFLYEQHIDTLSIKEGWKEISQMASMRDLHSKPTAARSRGMSTDRILSLVHKGKTQRGISKETMQSMASWIKMNEKIERKVKALREKEEEIYDRIIREADIVLATNAMVRAQMLENHHFDIAIIDEGSQQMIPSTLIPIAKADRFVIAGDHKQLPPTVVSNEARLKETLFEKLIARFTNLSHMLRIQYRMHEKIMAFSNRHFYDDKLLADKSVANHTLADFGLSQSQNYPDILATTTPLAFVDTSAVDTQEEQSARSTSYYNRIEATLCVSFAKELTLMGLKEENIGIITPYAAQIKMIKKELERENLAIETKTVDGFQGREKEVIIISFVRANSKQEIGFLQDSRRLNVAITRAKRKLIAIGHTPTLESDPLFKNFIAFMREENAFYRYNAL